MYTFFLILSSCTNDVPAENMATIDQIIETREHPVKTHY
jgi:hypothetical protein